MLWLWMKGYSTFKEKGNLVEPITLCVRVWRGLSDNQEPNHSSSKPDARVWGPGKTVVSPAFHKDYSGSNDCVLRNNTECIVYNLYLHISQCTLEYLYFFISIFKQRSGESVKVHQLDVAIPLHLKSQLRKGPPLGGGEGEAESADTMPFVMLTRKGNKQQVRNCPLRIQDC